ncbi:MAG TPA: patatin-like phospholipase family protein [Solirubrobacteraceae bacterium]|jgi:predicted acylesterase/phospholipase RssA/CRP-like cAMP-binding protein|nr:patatin-like phospholipase family protein [Solirubrobacteraceae bacterium]
MRTAAFLRNVPVLAGLSRELLERLALQVGEVHVRAGDWIMREGEAAESLFIVQSGRIEVIDEGPPEVLIRILRRGDVLGELALLREGTRSASVRARRDTVVLELSRAEFETLIQEAPSFALGLTRALGTQLAASRTAVVAALPPRTIAVVGLDAAAPVADVAERLADALAAHGSVARLAEGELATLDQAERDADRVILRGGATLGDGWTELCVREADVVVALTTGTPERTWLERPSALHGCELLALGPAVPDGLQDVLQPREVQVIADASRRQAALEATTRRFAARAVGIVFSGGGARALAHLGVLEELQAAGLRFDRAAGVSLGSLVAATTAAGFTSEEAYDAFERNFVDTNPSNDFVPPAYSLIRGAKTRRLLQGAFGERRIEELPLRFFCLSCDLVARKAVVHRTGRLVEAVYPSLAIPGVFPPVVTRDGRLLVDGGVLDNLPVATMARMGEGPVIAVDVTGRMGQFRGPRRPRMQRVARRIRRVLTASEAEIPRLGETIVRTVTVGSSDTVAAARLHADLVITPQVDDVGLMDWKSLPRVRELGRQAARDALAAHPELTSRLGI